VADEPWRIESLFVSPNQGQREAWNGQESVHYVDHADRYDRQLAPFAEALIAHANLEQHHRVLDVGCGCGVTTLETARRARRAVGVDISEPLLAVATNRARVESLDNAEFLAADAQVHPFAAATFDLVISQFGLMFFDDPVSAFRNLHRALVPDGRIVFVSWQPLPANEWLVVVRDAVTKFTEVPAFGGLGGGPGMFALQDRDETTELLRAAGFDAIDIESVSPPILIGDGGDVDETADFLLGMGMVRGLLGRLQPDERDEAMGEVRALLSARYEVGVGVRLGSAGWLMSARA
jgi:ubiquinone/menaquinone biosynthesis C-methylase UbiE